MSSTLMTHLVAGYPDWEGSLEAARGMIEGGTAYLEVQFPFSDPTADGPVIEEACTGSLAAGFTVDRGFELVRTLTGETSVPVYIMSYASIVVARGVERFCRQAADAGAAGLIIPDLPFDYDEGLYAAGRAAGLTVVPVVVSTISPARLETVLQGNPPLVYAALRAGITGSRTEIGEEITAFLTGLRERGIRVLAGFGIQDRAQVLMLEPLVHAAVVGSALVRVIREASGRSRTASGAAPGGLIRQGTAALTAELSGL